MLQVKLGFTMKGEPFYVSMHHTAVTGMSDLSGKTTTVEAELRRFCLESKGKALVFLTKRGEKVFTDMAQINEVPPYYRERFDWEYIRGLLEAAWHERLKFETPWIIRICKGATGLRDVRNRLAKVLADDESGKKRLKDIDKNQYTLLAAYMDKILPVLEESRHRISDTLDLKSGLNLMDLTDWYAEEAFQMVVIRSCMEWILAYENNVVIALPEAWKMLPQGRNTPVKLFFEKFIREGATNGNFLVIDAQDLGGVDKVPLRQVSVWIIGKMMESNEVERLLKQTLGLNVPPEEIQTLPLGHFFVADGVNNRVEKIYVWPWGIPEGMAISVAKKMMQPEAVKAELQRLRGLSSVAPKSPVLTKEYFDKLEKRLDEIEEHCKSCMQDCLFMHKVASKVTKDIEENAVQLKNFQDMFADHVKGNYVQFEDINKRLDRILKIATERSAEVHPLEITHLETPVKVLHQEAEPEKVSTSTVLGKILFTAIKDLKPDGFSESELSEKMKERGWNVSHSTLAPSLGNLVKEGKLVRLETRPMSYRLPSKLKFEL